MEIKRPLIEMAARLAYQAHITQTRKDDVSPYFIHPCMVAFKLAHHGFDDITIAAAYVHDVLEDTTVSADELERALGAEVVEIVQTLTEDKSLSWEERKARYIEIVSQASERTKAISCADKIHNLESLLATHAAMGSEVWKVFSRGKEAKAWFEHAMLTALQRTWQHPLVAEYTKLVQRLDELN